ncbi:unnamed protein product [marine sediment metagenome]|uniref:Uncharacterized protein n=1 Tax=marine sediment metagenome TaxID=412755 RepID=X1QMW3_9ZZZZ
MVMQRLKEEETPEQPLPIVRVCWDELFNFLRRLFKPKTARAWTELGNLPAETSTNYKKVFEAVVPAGFEGSLNEVSLYSSRPDTTLWALVIVEEVQFSDKRIYASLTLPYGGITIRTEQKVLLMAKTDGTATDIAGSLTGQLLYLEGG